MSEMEQYTKEKNRDYEEEMAQLIERLIDLHYYFLKPTGLSLKEIETRIREVEIREVEAKWLELKNSWKRFYRMK